jgi:hypothetical protein
MINEIDYKTEYLKIGFEVARIFPECEVTCLDMVRLLIFENDTLRMALKIPSSRSVIASLEDECNEN